MAADRTNPDEVQDIPLQLSLSPESIAFLANVGWTPDRRIDPTPYVEACQREGNSVVPQAAEFFSIFGASWWANLSWGMAPL